MIFYQVCVIGLCFAVVENAVTGNNCENYPARLGTLQPPFYFGYMSIDSDYNMVLKLKNVSRKITAVLVTVETDGPVSKYKWVGYNYEGDEFRICGGSTNSRVTIGLELYSSSGVCATRLVAEGRHVRTLQYGLADSTYESSHYCLNIRDNSCAIEMDLMHDCIESESYPNANRKKSSITPKPTLNTSTTLEPAISYIPKAVPNTPDTVRNTSRKPNRKYPDTPRPTQSDSRTTRGKSNTNTTRPATSYTPKVTQNVRNTSRTPNRKISDTPRPTQSTIPDSGHASSTLKPAISYTPKTSQHIPQTILNTSSTPNGKVFVTQIPTQNNTDNSKHTLVTPKPANSYTTKAPKNISNTLESTHNISEDHNKNTMLDTSEATRNTSDSQQEAQNISVIPNVTRVASDTSNAAIFRTDGADIKKYITITISSTVSVLVLILLVFVIRRCCRIKRNPSGSSQSLTNDLGDSPFYLNMLFRKECDREIEQIEQHHYEEINPQ